MEDDHKLTKLCIFQTNSPCQHLRKCIENSMENMHNKQLHQLTKSEPQNDAILPKLKVKVTTRQIFQFARTKV